jgi:hypothetical protein
VKYGFSRGGSLFSSCQAATESPLPSSALFKPATGHGSKAFSAPKQMTISKSSAGLASSGRGQWR